MADFDTIIRGGTIVDGTRHRERFTGDLGIKDGLIAAVTPAGGLAERSADRVVDAAGLVVAPGFVDLHTHYDGQILWDPYVSCSSWHGVTSVAIGNCGFGFAPTHPGQRERAMLSMERVEAIPLATMKAGMDWDWETFPQWLDSLQRRPILLLSPWPARTPPFPPGFRRCTGCRSGRRRRQGRRRQRTESPAGTVGTCRQHCRRGSS